MDKFRILIIEDFDEFRRFIVSFLRPAAQFLVISEASDAMDGLQQAQALCPDLM
jgi:chemotaxis response regulator CheB